MGVAYYIALDQETPGFDSLVDGKTVEDYAERINQLAADAGMPDLMSFFGMDGAAIGEIVGEDGIPDAGEWHDAHDGAAYFAKLTDLAADAGDLPQAAVDELRQFAAILRRAATAGARWQLAIDI